MPNNARILTEYSSKSLTMASAPPSTPNIDKENTRSVANTPIVPTKTNNVARASLSPINGIGYELKSKNLSTPLKSSSDGTDYEPKSKSIKGTSPFPVNRTAATPWVADCGIDYPHNGGAVPQHRDGISSELVAWRAGIHLDLGHGDTSPKEYRFHQFKNDVEVASCAVKVRNGLVTFMSRLISGAVTGEDGVFYKHSTVKANGWVLMGLHGHWRRGKENEKSIVQGMKRKLIILFCCMIINVV